MHKQNRVNREISFLVEEPSGNLIHCPFESRIDPTVSLVNEAALTDLDLLGVAAVHLASELPH
jgi:hypothetical protein